MIADLQKVIAEVFMIRTMVQLTDEQVKALKKLAKVRKTSVAQLVRESVTIYVASSAMTADREEKRRRALAGLEKIKKARFKDVEGKTDISKNHDQYLEEIYAA
jgi:predicted transcriptional regulator